jgi:TPR repeat protein
MQRPQAVRKEESAFTPPPRSSNNPLLWIGIVMIALIVTIIFFGERKPPSEPAAENTEQESPSERSASLGEDPPAPSKIKEIAAPDEPEEPMVPAMNQSGDEARGIIAQLSEDSGESQLNKVFKQAEELAESKKLEDAYLLYFFAARKGHAPSAFVLGELSDPDYYSPEKSPLGQADPVQALKWYRTAANLGYNKAKPRLKELEGWIRKQAQAGNTQAQQLLLNLP